MTIERSVALVGRPNVGKSRLFNRLAGKRVSIVHDQPGVTRDLITTKIPEDRGGYVLMDTGGLGLPLSAAPADIAEATEDQVDFAVLAAGLVLFVVDARDGLTLADEKITERLREYHKPTLLVVNKADDPGLEAKVIGDFYKLGLGEPIAVSAEHGRGMESLQNKILKVIGPPNPEAESVLGPDGLPAPLPGTRVRFSLVGRPNVGKSSLGNALLKSERLIVSDTPGTTRDAIAIDFDYKAPNGEIWPFTLQDTAGMRHGSKIKSSVEYFSQTRTQEAINESDVVFLVLSALEGVTKQDKFLAGEVLRAGRGLVIVVNKWDHARQRFESNPLTGYKNEHAFKKSFIAAIEKELYFMPRSPVLFTSAIEGTAVMDILQEAHSLHETMMRELPTGLLNRVLRDCVDVQPPKRVGGRRFKCYYALRVARQPFVIRMYCNSSDKLDEPYSRHLESVVSEAFQLRGCPVRFDLIGKPKRERSAPGLGGTTSGRNGKRTAPWGTPKALGPRIGKRRSKLVED